VPWIGPWDVTFTETILVVLKSLEPLADPPVKEMVNALTLLGPQAHLAIVG